MPRGVGSTGESDSYDLTREGFAAVRARWWLVLLVPLLAMAGVAAHALLVNPAYEAEVTLAFDPPDSGSTLGSLGLEGKPPPARDQLLSDSVLAAFRDRRAPDAADPRGRLRVRSASDREATLVAEGDSSAAASDLANDWAQALATTRNSEQGARIERARVALERRLAAAGPVVEPPTARQLSLQQDLDRLDAAQQALRPDTEVTRAARVNAQGASAGAYLTAAGVALVAGLALALLVGTLDRRIRSPERLAKTFGLPLLGRLRGNGGPAGPAPGGPDPASRLYARLMLYSGGVQPPTILVTAATAGADTALAAYAVAASIASSDRDVALVGWHPGGLGRTNSRREGHVTLIEDGAPWPDFLLRVADLSFSHDVVVVCAPPLADVAESLLAAQAMSAWFVCASLGDTRIEDARTLRGAVEGLRRPPSGLLALSRERNGWTRLLDEEARQSASHD